MSTAGIAAVRPFDAGRVISGTIGAYVANLAPFLLIGAVGQGLAGFIAGWLNGQAALHPVSLSGSGESLAASAITTVSVLFVQALIVPATMAHLDGQPVDFTAYALRAPGHLWPLFLVSLLVGLAVGFGVVLLVVPGLLLMTRWSVALQTQLAENTGVMASMGRSAELTRGRRWAVFGLLLLYVVALGIAEVVVFGLITQFKLGVLDALRAPRVQLLAGPTMSALFGPISAVGGAALYHELRGEAGAEVAKVFE